MTDDPCGFKRRGRAFVIPAVVLLVMSLCFFFSDWDLKLSELFFDQATGKFPLHKSFWPRVSYYVVPAIGMAMGLGGLFVVLGGVWHNPWRRFRKEALFLFLLVALGPGLLVNGVFKANFGRPRPNQCVAFGGERSYQPVLVYVRHPRMHKFQSFPCGHASIGFALMGPYFFLRNRHRRKAHMFMLLGLLMGGWAGVARMMEGRHFASDVIWAAGMVYFVGLGLARLFKFEDKDGVVLT